MTHKDAGQAGSGEQLRQQHPMWDLLQAYGDACEGLGQAAGALSRAIERDRVNATWEDLWKHIASHASLSAENATLREQMADWRAWAVHQEYCGDCAQDVSYCSVGMELKQAAHVPAALSPDRKGP